MFVYLVRISNHLQWDLEHDATSKQQKNTSIFIFALTFLLKMACTKMDKSDFSSLFFSFNLYFLLSTLSVSCPMSLFFYYNLQFMFFIFRFQK
jgi:hypothetical protein